MAAKTKLIPGHLDYPTMSAAFLKTLANSGRVVGVVEMFLRAAVAGLACYPGTPANWCNTLALSKRGEVGVIRVGPASSAGRYERLHNFPPAPPRTDQAWLGKIRGLLLTPQHGAMHQLGGWARMADGGMQRASQRKPGQMKGKTLALRLVSNCPV